MKCSHGSQKSPVKDDQGKGLTGLHPQSEPKPNSGAARWLCWSRCGGKTPTALMPTVRHPTRAGTCRDGLAVWRGFASVGMTHTGKPACASTGVPTILVMQGLGHPSRSRLRGILGATALFVSDRCQRCSSDNGENLTPEAVCASSSSTAGRFLAAPGVPLAKPPSSRTKCRCVAVNVHLSPHTPEPPVFCGLFQEAPNEYWRQRANVC